MSGQRVAVIHCGFTYSGGGERLVLEQVRGLRERGFVVDCYAPTIDGDRCFPELVGEVEPRPLFPQLPRWMPLRDAVQMLAASVLAPLLAFTLPRYDVLVGANQPGAWIAAVMSRIRGIPYVVYLNQPCRLVYPRDIDLETGWQTKRDYQLLNALIQRLRRFVRWADWVSVQGANELLVNGGFIGERISRVYRRAVSDCPAAARAPEGPPEPATAPFAVNGTAIAPPYVLLTNRHYPQKRFDLALRAIAELAAHGHRVPLVITGGRTGYTPQLEALCAELGVSDLVRFVGEVREADLSRLYASATVYVYTSPEEDFGLGVLEAMAHGVPVVAWRSGGPTVTVRDGATGFLVAPYSVHGYAERIARLLRDPILRRRMGSAAARHVRDAFGWSRHLDTLVGSLDRAMRAEAEPTAPAGLAPERRSGRRAYTAVWEKRRLIASLRDAEWVLDAGAGGGEYVPYLLLRGRRVVALDLDPVRVRQLQRRFANVPNVFVVQASVSALPFADQSIGLVWASEIVEHLPRLAASMDELERVSSRQIVATLPSPTGPYRYLDRSHVLRYTIGGLRRELSARTGWRYEVEGFGLCLPQWLGLDRARERWLAFSRQRPWAAWTLLIRAERSPVRRPMPTRLRPRTGGRSLRAPRVRAAPARRAAVARRARSARPTA